MAKNKNAVAVSKEVNKEVIVPVTSKQEVEVIKVVTKADKARAIFDECYKMDIVPQRKDIINRLVAEAGLTKAGGATYLQNYKSKNGLTAKKESTPS